MTQTLNEQKLDVLRILRAMLISGHIMKLQDIDRDISEVEKLIEVEHRKNELSVFHRGG